MWGCKVKVIRKSQNKYISGDVWRKTRLGKNLTSQMQTNLQQSETDLRQSETDDGLSEANVGESSYWMGRHFVKLASSGLWRHTHGQPAYIRDVYTVYKRHWERPHGVWSRDVTSYLFLALFSLFDRLEVILQPWFLSEKTFMKQKWCNTVVRSLMISYKKLRVGLALQFLNFFPIRGLRVSYEFLKYGNF